jgi:hypothetical protein
MKRSWRRLVPPITLLILLTWVMVGCVYIPTFEHVQLTGSKADFRQMTGDKPDEHKIIPGRTTRAQIEAVLGPPRSRSDDGRSVVYVIDTHQGLWTVPLCFFATRYANWKRFELLVSYDANDVVEKYTVPQRSQDLPPPIGIIEDGNPFDRPGVVVMPARPTHPEAATCPTAPTSSTN